MKRQPELPFLTVDQAAAIDEAVAVIDQFQGKAIAGRRWADAEQLGRLGAQLVGILETNAAAVRSAR